MSTKKKSILVLGPGKVPVRVLINGKTYTANIEPCITMATVLEQLYETGHLAYTDPKNGRAGFLSRSDGPCTFYVNNHWIFPKGCPYGKPDEKQYPVGFLEMVTSAMVGNNRG